MISLKQIYYLPEMLNGIEDLNDFTRFHSWKEKITHIARLPLLGVITSSVALLLSSVRLVISIVISPFLALASIFARKDYISDTLVKGVGNSSALLLFGVINIATLGTLSWTTKLSRGDSHGDFR